MQEVGLDPDDRTKVRNYSVGMNQKLGLVQALMEEEEVLILDEPLNGLDKASRQKVINLLNNIFQKRHPIIILVSHDDEFSEMVSKILEIDGEYISEKNVKTF